MAKHQFQTEANQILNLMIHSLYSNKEIFLRELVSNASDALDKLNMLVLTDDAYKGVNFVPRIDIVANKEAKTLTIKDSGIGMNEEDLMNNLGTIAKSGTKAFLENLTGDQKKDSNLIGKFGVGFYACFMVAHRVEVTTKKAGEDQAYLWTSKGDGEFEIEHTTQDGHGTTIVMHLNDEEGEFLDSYRVESIIKKYSNHIPFAIFMDKENYIAAKKDDEGKEIEPSRTEIENVQINRANALWTIAKNEIIDEEYKDFYSSIAHSSEEPLAWMHNKAEGAIEYTTLFYIPSKAPMEVAVASANNAFSSFEDMPAFFLKFSSSFSSNMPLFLPVPRKVPIVSKVSVSEKANMVVKAINTLDGSANSPTKSSLNKVGAILGIAKLISEKLGTLVILNNIPVRVVIAMPSNIALLTFKTISTIVTTSPIKATSAIGSLKFTIAGITSWKSPPSPSATSLFGASAVNWRK